MSTTEAIFTVNGEGFRAQNSDRPAAHLVRELIQNALDEEGVTKLDVTITYNGPRKGTTVKVVDNAPSGVRDPKLLFTIWLSDKEDSPLKRGRMGRGLKEIVSVADETTIRSCSIDAISFKRHQGGRWERKSKPKLGRTAAGTEVVAFCRGWGEKDAKSIVAFLRRVRAPQAITMTVTYEQVGSTYPLPVETVAPFQAGEKYELYLPTVVYEAADGERKARDRGRICTVECFTPPPGERAFVYEMGIPVEECDSPVSIDVGQRVILRERRDTLTESYRRELFAKVLNQRIALLPDEALRDNAVLTASANYYQLSDATKQRIAHVWTEGKPYASNPQDRAHATGHHIEVVNLRGLPEGIRDIVKSAGTDVKVVMEQRKSEFCPGLPMHLWTADQARLVKLYTWVAAGIGRACTTMLREGRPGAAADFDRGTNTLSIYVEAMGPKFFRTPAGPEQLSLLIHELSHYTPKADEHGSDFAHDNDDVGGAVAAFLLTNAEQARLLLKGE